MLKNIVAESTQVALKFIKYFYLVIKLNHAG